MTNNVLLVKLSSLGDVVHCFPALSDAHRHGVRFDWVVEEAFVDLAQRHPAVDRVIPFALRRWRKEGVRGISAALKFRRDFAAMGYSRVLDAQGLLKSALVARASGAAQRSGLAGNSAREPLSARFYTRHSEVSWELHAIDRLRRLFAQSLDYEFDPALPAQPASGFVAHQASTGPGALVLVHGTTWPSKEYPEAGWRALIGELVAGGRSVHLLSGSATEHDRAQRLCDNITGATALIPESLPMACERIAQAAGVVGVDSGLTHLAAVLGRPTVGLYGATDSLRTGVRGVNAADLTSQFRCAPCLRRQCSYTGELPLLAGQEVQPACFAELDTDTIVQTLERLIGRSLERPGSAADPVTPL